MSDTLTPQAHETAADLKMRIEKYQAEQSGAIGKPLADGVTPVAATVNGQAKTEVPQAPTPEPKGAKTSPNNDVDLHNWAKAKGIDWTSETSVLEALRKSDQEYHKRHQEQLKEQKTNQAPAYTQPSYAPPVSSGYAPPAPPQISRQALEQIGRNYNMAPEDAERLIAFNNDFVESKLNIERQRLQKEFEDIRKANSKNDIFRELSSDPTFRNPQVLHEYHRTLEEMQDRDPKQFDEDPSAYKRVFDQTLINIARRNLQGDAMPNHSQANSYMPPSNPPRPIGTGGTGEMHRENELSEDEFKRLPVEDQRAILSRMGLVSSKY